MNSDYFLPKTNWEGYYYDGKVAIKHKVKVYLSQNYLSFITSDEKKHIWEYKNIKLKYFSPTEPILLEKGEDIPETLIIEDYSFLENLYYFAPLLKKDIRFQFRKLYPNLPFFAGAGIILFLIFIYFFGVPATSLLVAKVIPISWEESLGKKLMEEIAPHASQCKQKDAQIVLNTLMKKITLPVKHPQYKFNVIVVKNPTVNALALPGGYVIVYEGLLNHTKEPEELAGVLAHEIQHILLKHPTRRIIEHTSLSFFLNLVWGSSKDIGMNTAFVLGMLKYSRNQEEEADIEALKLLLNATISPHGFITFLESFKEKEKYVPEIFIYLSTHPPTEYRVQKLRNFISDLNKKFKPPLENKEWEEIKQICK